MKTQMNEELKVENEGIKAKLAEREEELGWLKAISDEYNTILRNISDLVTPTTSEHNPSSPSSLPLLEWVKGMVNENKHLNSKIELLL